MKKYILAALLTAVSMIAFAVPAKREWRTYTQPDGTTIDVMLVGDEFYHFTVNRDGEQVRLDKDGFYKVAGAAPSRTAIKARREQSKFRRMRKEVGTKPNLAPRGLVILVNYADTSFQPAHTKAVFDELCNSTNCTVNTYNGVKYPSAAQYFADQSNGAYRPVFDVVGPVTLSKGYDFYGHNIDADGNPISSDDKPEILDADGNPISSDDKADGSDDGKEPKDERKIVYYVTDVNQQGQYISMFKDQDMNAVILDHNIDTSFITQLEQRNEQYRFCRIDGDLTDSLVDEDASAEEETKSLSEVFKKFLSNDKLTVKAEKLKDEAISSILTVKEESRRMADMMKMYSMNGMGGMDANLFPQDETLILNTAHPLVQYLLEHPDSDKLEDLVHQLYDLARIQNAPLSPDDMKTFVKRTNDIMLLMTA